ncbi:hypothetical protein BKA56DRAFT_35585 [Ilyonectria sp. MPI-CAGE-AT-0026]|nr:hypothetical protein BKA56DRAFT_35585 [Ilyonectria sp. MPI-CAGE-AT-0026]
MSASDGSWLCLTCAFGPVSVDGRIERLKFRANCNKRCDTKATEFRTCEMRRNAETFVEAPAKRYGPSRDSQRGRSVNQRCGNTLTTSMCFLSTQHRFRSPVPRVRATKLNDTIKSDFGHGHEQDGLPPVTYEPSHSAGCLKVHENKPIPSHKATREQGMLSATGSHTRATSSSQYSSHLHNTPGADGFKGAQGLLETAPVVNCRRTAGSQVLS